MEDVFGEDEDVNINVDVDVDVSNLKVLKSPNTQFFWVLLVWIISIYSKKIQYLGMGIGYFVFIQR